MRYINWHFTHLLTYLLTYLQVSDMGGSRWFIMFVVPTQHLTVKFLDKRAKSWFC